MMDSNYKMISEYVSILQHEIWHKTYGEDLPLEKASPNANHGESGFFHYTSLSNALKILELKKEDDKDKVERYNAKFISLWASHFLFLNDTQELADGLKIACENITAKKDSGGANDRAKEWLLQYLDYFSSIGPNDNIYNAPNSFILCFCLKGNILSQWMRYGKESGIAIEFDLDNCQYEGFSPPRPKHTRPGEPAPSIGYYEDRMEVIPRRILYADDDKTRYIKKITQKAINRNNDAVHILAMQALAAASFMKHPGFEDESEVRLLFSPNYYPEHTAMDAAKLIQYRETDGILKPYMDIHIKHNDSDKKIIKSITVGPGLNQTLVLNAIIKLVQTRFTGSIDPVQKFNDWDVEEEQYYKHTMIGDIEVRCSTLPYRSQT
ncbi:MAG: DUF2971 domain-containing protein [Synergistaceae bacterium]|nr:DUF2971 domain-containing protein [Synergistaceae bacterium]